MSISQWPEQERPRERLLQNGAKSLSDAELLAIFLGSGTRGLSAVDLARNILQEFGSLRNLCLTNKQAFCAVHGLGPATYSQLMAALELATRHYTQAIENHDIFTNPAETKRFLSAKLADYPYEVFACLFLNTKNRLIAFEEITQGGLSQAPVSPREIMKRAMNHNAASLILAHNHPSGDCQPSQADIQFTRSLHKAFNPLELSILDHIVVGQNQTFSFAENNLVF